MSLVVLLDAGPLGLITNPRGSSETYECNLWLESLISRGIEVKIPEIADYEVRRELLRAEKSAGIKRLDTLKNYVGYIPLTTQTMLMAAQILAQLRKQGKPTADYKTLHCDLFLSAHAVIVAA